MQTDKQKEPLLESPYPGPFPRHLLAPRYWGTWFGIGLLWLLTRLPARWRRGLGRWIGEQMYRRNRKRQRFTLLNLRWCFPQQSEAENEALALAYFRNMGQSLLDYGMLWWASDRTLDREITLEGEEYIRPYVEAGTPIILLTGHHTALDVAGIAYNRHYRVVSIFKEVRNPVLDWFVANGRNRYGAAIYERSDNMRPLIKAVRQGYALYYLPDEDLGPEHSVFVDFFGVPTATIPALGRLVKMCKAVVVPIMAYYDEQNDRYVTRCFPAVEDFPTDDEQAAAQRMNELLEMMIRVDPSQYMWSLRMFQTRPDGEPNPYG